MSHLTETPKFRVFTQRDLERIPQLQALPTDMRDGMKAVASVLPFRVNQYVIDELIDWSRVPDDPIFQLTFPQAGMLHKADYEQMLSLVRKGAGKDEIAAAAKSVQRNLNPHPAGQKQMNVPHVDGVPLPGMQHKYRETVLFFPTQGQTCHAYCTYCFRWAQFVGLDDMKFAGREPELLASYLKQHPEVRSVLFTGGDPMVMKTRNLRQYIEPLLQIEHINSIRIGTKAVAYWPQRFVNDPDAKDLLSLFSQVVESGKHLAVMGHYSHPRELSTPIAREAVSRIRSTGAVLRCQAPLIKHVNDDPEVWAEMWKTQLNLGAIPYYMFVERDTGAKAYFEVPLARALKIFQTAYGTLSGLGRTVRGPSMSALPGKVMVDGISEINGEKVFALKFIQARNPEWVKQIFFARYDAQATWLHQLKPAFGEREFFFEPELREMERENRARSGPRDMRRSLPLADEAQAAQ